jgi:hypothetical protein
MPAAESDGTPPASGGTQHSGKGKGRPEETKVDANGMKAENRVFQVSNSVSNTQSTTFDYGAGCSPDNPLRFFAPYMSGENNRHTL